jgi:hypothetical protein
VLYALLISLNVSPDLTWYVAAYTELLVAKAKVKANNVLFKFNFKITSPPL